MAKAPSPKMAMPKPPAGMKMAKLKIKAKFTSEKPKEMR